MSNRIEGKLYQNRYMVDAGRPHIKVREHDVPSEPLKSLVTTCPAGCYSLNEQGKVEIVADGCMECGTCRVVCAPGSFDTSFTLLKTGKPQRGIGRGDRKTGSRGSPCPTMVRPQGEGTPMNEPLIEMLSCVTDCRREQAKRYRLANILMFCILGFLCGAKSHKSLCSFIAERFALLQAAFPSNMKRAPAPSTLWRIIGLIDRAA